jgi:putative ABC transport system permease protein
MLERVRALPGVTAAGLSNCPPLGGGCNGTMVTRRDRPPAAPGMDPEVAVHWLSPGFPEAMRLPLVRGRLFDSRDHREARKAVLVNETAAKKIWPGEDPLGKPVSVGQGGFHDDTALVVGVVGDVRYASMSAPPEASVYLPYSQSPLAGTMLFVRTAGDPVSVAPAVRRIVREIAPDFPIYDMRTMEERAAESLGYARFTTLLLAIFGALALGLATLGIYGVIAFAVAQRTKEIGIRMALGATRGEVLRDVIGRGAVLAAGGVAFGLAGAIATTGVLRSQLYGVAPNDPLVLAAMVGLILLAAVIASWLPARRAATVAPTEALRGG